MVRLVALIALFLVWSAAPARAATGLPVTLAWDANPEPTVIGYRLYVGLASGNYTGVYDVGNVTQFTFSGGTVGVTYYFAVAAYVTGQLEGPKSNEVSTVIQPSTSPTPPPPSPTPPPPSPTPTPPPPPPPDDGPTQPTIILDPPVVDETTVTLTWRPSTTVKVLEYLLEVGSGPGLTDLFNGSIGTVTRIRGTVNPGTYYVRIRGRLDGGVIISSNEVSFAIDEGGTTQCTAPPPPPDRVTGSITNAGVATVSWRPVAGATSYVVQAGSGPGLSDVFNGDVGPYTAVSTDVPPGFQAYVRVMAVNSCGRSAASYEILIK